jgi:hypothetical protein
MSRKFGPAALLAVGAAWLALVAGCSDSRVEAPKTDRSEPVKAAGPAAPSADEHAHKPGAHGGNVVAIGRDNYHAEAVFEAGGTVRLFTLGKDEAKVEEVDLQVLTAFARPEGAAEAVAFKILPVPQPGDAPGKTSQLVGRLPRDIAGRKVEVTVPALRIGGERFRLAFTSPEGHDEGMPAKVADEKERQLYLTPGGKYTQADIKANGGMTASEKFQGRTSAHDAHPRRGERICPVTATKANPEFTWVVGGKTYQFCCPPCVDEFVKTAKEHPEEIKDPGDYVKK